MLGMSFLFIELSATYYFLDRKYTFSHNGKKLSQWVEAKTLEIHKSHYVQEQFKFERCTNYSNKI
jgi:hypothetical protein